MARNIHENPAVLSPQELAEQLADFRDHMNSEVAAAEIGKNAADGLAMLGASLAPDGAGITVGGPQELVGGRGPLRGVVASFRQEGSMESNHYAYRFRGGDGVGLEFSLDRDYSVLIVAPSGVERPVVATLLVQTEDGVEPLGAVELEAGDGSSMHDIVTRLVEDVMSLAPARAA
jgi:hypothetical protein